MDANCGNNNINVNWMRVVQGVGGAEDRGYRLQPFEEATETVSAVQNFECVLLFCLQKTMNVSGCGEDNQCVLAVERQL